MTLEEARAYNDLQDYINDLPVVTPIYSDGIMLGCVLKVESCPTLFKCVVVDAKGHDKALTFTSKHETRLSGGKCIAYEDALSWAQYIADTGKEMIYEEPPISLHI
jgi:hypothetical protein